MKSVVINPFFDWADDRAPMIPYHETMIYEAHVRGLTLRHPDIPPAQREPMPAVLIPPSSIICSGSASRQ